MLEFDEDVYIIIEGKRVPLGTLDEKPKNEKKKKEKSKDVDEPKPERDDD